MVNEYKGCCVDNLYKENSRQVSGACVDLVKVEYGQDLSFLSSELLELLFLEVVDLSHLEHVLVRDDVLEARWWVREVTYFLFSLDLKLLLLLHVNILFRRTLVAG
jgi:hypothetical protein